MTRLEDFDETEVTILSFEPLASDPTDPPQYGIWFVK